MYELVSNTHCLLYAYVQARNLLRRILIVCPNVKMYCKCKKYMWKFWNFVTGNCSKQPLQWV